jgi:hypothetical protein
VLLGLVAGDRLTPGMIGVTIITTMEGVARGVWTRGWLATVLFVAINRRHEARLHADVVRDGQAVGGTREGSYGPASFGGWVWSRSGLPPIILSIGPPPERKNRHTSAAARSRKTMFSQVV